MKTMKFKDIKTGESFDVNIEDVELRKENRRHYAIAISSNGGHEVWKSISYKLYLELKKG